MICVRPLPDGRGSVGMWGGEVKTRFLVVLVAVLLFSTDPARGQAPAVVPFAAETALAHATYLASEIGERPAGTLGEQQAAGWLAGEFAALGYVVRVQPFPFNRLGQPLVGMNVIATKPGLPGYGAVYVGAHYDTVGIAPGFLGGPGAIDNASGVGVMLEGARLAAGAFYTPTLHFIAFGAEEDYLIGSGRFVNGLSGRERVAAVGMLNLDCVGWGDEFRLIIAREVDRPFAESLGVAPDWLGSERWGASDHLSFTAVGIPAAFFNLQRDDLVCGPAITGRATPRICWNCLPSSAPATRSLPHWTPFRSRPPRSTMSTFRSPSARQPPLDHRQLTINN
jgi:hypothetical protein